MTFLAWFILFAQPVSFVGAMHGAARGQKVPPAWWALLAVGNWLATVGLAIGVVMQ